MGAFGKRVAGSGKLITLQVHDDRVMATTSPHTARSQSEVSTDPLMPEMILNNARLVLDDEVLLGHLRVQKGVITDVGSGVCCGGVDFQGDYLLPGLIELHTDHLETHFRPRPKVLWPAMAAIQSHDAQIATSGITTVFDCLRLGTVEQGDIAPGEIRKLADALVQAKAEQRLRIDHRLHLRCEVSASNLMADMADFDTDPHVGLISVMDHAPGQRQFASLEAAAIYYQGVMKMDDAEFHEFVSSRQAESDAYADRHRQAIASHCQQHNITLASHDDATLEHVDESIGLSVKLAEFPTTLEAARHAHTNGIAVMMGAPNMVRDQSHSGNVTARELAEQGCLDILSSDYVPFSPMQAVFMLAGVYDLMSLPEAVKLVTTNPASIVALTDRGRISNGLRADLVRIHQPDRLSAPVVRSVWSEGERVA